MIQFVVDITEPFAHYHWGYFVCLLHSPQTRVAAYCTTCRYDNGNDNDS